MLACSEPQSAPRVYISERCAVGRGRGGQEAMETNLSSAEQTPPEQTLVEVGEIERVAETNVVDHMDPETLMDSWRSISWAEMGENLDDFKARQKALLEAAKLNHGSKGDLLQEIFNRNDTTPLDQDTYRELKFSRMHQAAWERLNKDVFASLMSIPGEDVNARDCKGQTPLHIAAFWGSDLAVEYLLGCTGINITENGGSAFTPLHLAADRGHLEVVKMLLLAVQKAKGDAGLKDFVNSVDSELNRTALHYACRNGNVEVVRELLKCKDINIEEPDAFGYTPALLAVIARGDHKEVVKLFLSIEDPEGRPFKSLGGQMDFNECEPEEDIGVLYGEKDWRLMFGCPNLVDSYYCDTYYFTILPWRLRKDFDRDWKMAIEDSLFFSATRLAVQGNNGKVLLCLLNYIVDSFGNDKNVILSQSHYADSTNIENLVNELMHYAARIGSSKALKVLLHFKPSGDNASEDYNLDINSMLNDKTAAFAAVQSLYKFAHVKVIKEDDKYNLMLWTTILDVVNEFCSMKEFDAINRDSKNNTLLYYISESLDVLPKTMHKHLKTMRRICVESAMVRLMINSSHLTQLCDYYTQEKQNLQNGCNALLVGATLIAALAVSGMLSPPQPLGGTRHIDRVLNIYWTCNSLSFYFAVYTMISCLKVLMPRRKEYIEEELKKLTMSVALSSLGLTMTTTLAIGAYIAGEHLNGPSRTLALHSTVFGLLFLIPFIFGAIGNDCWRLLHRLFDFSNWRLIRGACYRFFLFWAQIISHNLKIKFGMMRRKHGSGENGVVRSQNHFKKENSLSKKIVQPSDPTKKAQSKNNDLRGLNVDDIDDLVATLQILIIPVVLVGTIVIFVGNLFAKLDG